MPRCLVVLSRVGQPSALWMMRITCDCSRMPSACRSSPGLGCSLRRGWKRYYWRGAIAEAPRRYLMREVFRRDRDLVDQLRDLYPGECQICGWAPRRSYGTEL